MKLKQFQGPFTSGQILEVPAETGYTYVHIGIQSPTSQLRVPSFEVNGERYEIGKTGVLEFDGISEISWNIKCLQAMPMETIIDIAYRYAN